MVDESCSGDQFAVGRGAEAHALLGPRAMAHALKHHGAGQYQLDRTVEIACAEAASAVRPGPQFAAEAGAEKARNDPYVLRLNSQHLGHDIAMVDNRLRGFVEGEGCHPRRQRSSAVRSGCASRSGCHRLVELDRG